MTFEEWFTDRWSEDDRSEIVASDAWDHQQSVIDGLQTEIDKCTATVKRLTVDALKAQKAREEFDND